MSTEYAVTLSRFQFSDMLIEYLLTTKSQTVGLRLYPSSMAGRLVMRREFLQTFEVLLQPKSAPPMRAWQVEPLVQIKLVGDPVSGYSQGVTLRNSDTLSSLRYAGQEVFTGEGQTEVVTSLRSDRGYACEHHLLYRQGDEALTIQTVFRNEGQESLSLELLASFSFSG